MSQPVNNDPVIRITASGISWAVAAEDLARQFLTETRHFQYAEAKERAVRSLTVHIQEAILAWMKTAK